MATTTRRKHKQMAEEAERQKLVHKKAEEIGTSEGETERIEGTSEREKERIEETIRNEIERIDETSESEIDPDYEVGSDILSEGSYEEEVSYCIISDEEDGENNEEKLLKKRKPPSKNTRPRTSWVWKFFKLNEDNTKAICQIEGCEKSLIWCGSPSSLQTHLSGVHHITKAISMKYDVEDLTKNIIKDLDNLIIIEENTETTSKPHHITKQEALTRSVMGFVIGTVQPLSILEDKDFINMINEFDKRYKIPCVKTFKNRVSSAYEIGKDLLKNQLDQVQDISITLDAWSSSAHIPYLGITVHWITSEFEPRELLLSMEELPYPHGAIEIQEYLIDLFDEWEVGSKINAIVTDNGANVKKACNNLGIGERVPCAAHTLQLSIEKGLNTIRTLINKCKNLITFLATDKKKQQLKETQIHLYQQQKINNELNEEEIEKFVYLDVVKANNTRWNSTFYAFQRLIILKTAISMLKISLVNDSNPHAHREGEKLEELYPTFYEWKTIKEIVILLDPFENVTCLLSGATYPTIGLTYPSMCNLKEILENDFGLMETEDGQNCRNAILEDLERRWEFPQELCLKASFFDLRFKSLDFIKSQQICNNIIKKLQEEYKTLKQNLSSVFITSDENKSNPTAMENFWKKKNSRMITPVKDELQHYLSLPELPALEEYDPFKWWTTNKTEYPVLHKLAIKYLSIPATSVPSERLFSDANNLITPQRNRLDSFLVNQLMFLKRNRKHIDIFGVEAK
jgi:hypothetical protein